MGLLDTIVTKAKSLIQTAYEVNVNFGKKNNELNELVAKLNDNKAKSVSEINSIVDSIKNLHDGETITIKGILNECNWEEDGICSVEVFGIDEYICYHVQVETTDEEVPDLHGEIVEATGVIGQTEQDGFILRGATVKYVPNKFEG